MANPARYTPDPGDLTAATAVILPTFNERDTIAEVVERLLAANHDVRVLIVDDNSPDGTGQIAERLADADTRVSVLHRPAKAGLGPAYIAGFRWALEHDFAAIVEMDSDGSHQPEQLPGLLEALNAGAALAIGTRWMPGGSIQNWPLYRRLVSRAGTAFARIMLRSSLRDITSGFRAFTRDAMLTIDLDRLDSKGYGFQVELAWRIERSGLRIVEVPITFVERTTGHSKMTVSIVLEALWRVALWGVTGGDPVRRENR